MDYYLLLARSVTRAQWMDAELRKRGLTAELVRSPAGLTEKGCAYALKLPRRRYAAAMQILKDTGQTPFAIFYVNGEDVREVRP